MLKRYLTESLETAVDFGFIKSVVGDTYKIAMLDYESFTENTTLEKIFKKRDCVAILFHIVTAAGNVTPIGHWTLLIKATKKKPIQFYDSLGFGLRKILSVTHEKPHLLNILQGKKWTDSTVAMQTQGRMFRECGAFVAVRALLANLTNSEYVKFLRTKSSQKSDRMVITLTLLHYIKYYKFNKQKR